MINADQLQVVVTDKSMLSVAVCQLTLASEDGTVLPSWSAGAHIDVLLENDLIRQYSLCGEPGSDKYQIAVLLDPNSRGGSRYIHNNVQAGDTLTISIPRNHFGLDTSASPCWFFAAGIGITPIVSQVEACQQKQRPYKVVYAVSSDESAIYAERLGNPTHVHLYSKKAFKQRLSIAACFEQVAPDTHVYVCGPNAFIEDVLAGAKQAGLPGLQIHREYFNASDAASAPGGAFEVEIASTGEVYRVEEDSTILSTLEEHGVFVPVSCEEGVCGTCVTGLKAGEADHRDVFLTDEEKADNKLITVCCSRAKSARLLLDL